MAKVSDIENVKVIRNIKNKSEQFSVVSQERNI